MSTTMPSEQTGSPDRPVGFHDVRFGTTWAFLHDRRDRQGVPARATLAAARPGRRSGAIHVI